MTTPDIAALAGEVTVALPLDRAFAFFTGSFGSWWPAVYHIGQTGMADAIIEARDGGRWYERGTDGSECDWGRVLAWEPPNRLVLTWQINGYWQYDPDPEHASEIEVRCTEEGPERTSVTLEHRHLDRLVADTALRDALVEQGGWRTVLEQFAKTAEAQT